MKLKEITIAGVLPEHKEVTLEVQPQNIAEIPPAEVTL